MFPKQSIYGIILQPDITAPGVDILAAYTPAAPPSADPFDRRDVKFNVMSGTSMACPHVAGVAAYVKSLHPDWSHSAIKSALRTTGNIFIPNHFTLLAFISFVDFMH